VSQENVEIVLRAFTAGVVSEPPDVKTLYEVFDPDHIYTSSWGVDSAEYHGVQGLLTARAEMSAIWDSWQQELERVIDAKDEGVVGLLRFRAKGRGSAVPVEVQWAMVATLRNGKIVTSRAFLSHDEALKAVGLGH
jgi:ketosteroid isomerase-like protein